MARCGLLVAGMALAVAACGTGGAQTASPAASAAATPPSTAAAVATTRPSIAPRPLPGCLNPACVPGRLARPGALPAGPYTTRYFLASRLGVVMPAGWESPEDSSGEFKVQPAGNDLTTLDFWIDIYPIVDGTGDPAQPVKGFDGTAAALLAWLAANPNIDTTDPQPAQLGNLDAQVIDITRSPKARNVDPGCPSEGQPCVGLFGNAWWEGFYGQGGPFKLRLFAADASWAGTQHAVYAMITTDSPESFGAFEAAAGSIVASAVFPSDVLQP